MSLEQADETVPEEVLDADEQEDEECEVANNEDGVADSEQLDWSTFTVAALKAELFARGLQTTGRKVELIARLESNDMGENDVHSAEGENKNENEENSLISEATSNEDSQQELQVDPPQEIHEEVDDGNDEIPEGDEFVEWNEDAEGAMDDSKICDDSLKVVQVVDELKLDADEHEDGSEAKLPEEKVDLHVEEGDVKNEDGELSVDVHREKDLFYLTWQSKKITVPFKNEIMKDLQTIGKLQTIYVYPILLSDLYSEELKKYAEKAIGVELELEDTVPGSPPKGYLKLKFTTYDEVLEALESLKTFKEDITVKSFSKDDLESDVRFSVMNQLRKEKKEDSERKGPIIYRLVYVGNLPSDATEATLREHFPDTLQVYFPYNAETLERLGYAYLEFADEKIAYEMSEKFKDTEINGEKLYVIQAISEKKEKYGLLRDSLRLYWSEQTQHLRKILEKPYSRPQWEISDIEQKLRVLKRRLEKDDRRRETLRLPHPAGEKKPDRPSTDEDKSASKKDSRSKSRDIRSSHHNSRSTGRRSPRRSPPPQRREYRPQRPQSSHVANFPSRREEVADKLVNQLQGLVSVLANKMPTMESSRPPRLDDLQFGPLVNLFDQQRRLGTGSVSSSGFRGNSYDNQGSSARYSSGKRFQDDDYGGDRKRRMTDYNNSGSSSNRYDGGNNSRGGRGGQSYNDDRYGNNRRDNQGSSGRPFSGRSKWP